MTTTANPVSTQTSATRLDFGMMTEDMLKVLDARSRDIITRRFGLKNDEKETLESIGKEYGITRERVRQIESNAKKALSNLDDVLAASNTFFVEMFQSNGGALAESHVVELTKEKLGYDVAPNMIHFHLEILPDFRYVTTAKLFDPHWRHVPSVHARIDDIVSTAQNILKNYSHPIELNSLIEEIQTELVSETIPLPRSTVYAALVASKHVAPTAFTEWGLIGWAETSPRGVGDKAYAVLRRHGKPSHFREITDLINSAGFDHKMANPQTVHNELIKDSRFVLVGRGLYGLKEWGFMTGTVADVLETILKKAQEPLSRDELIKQVLKQRLVKKNTILLSLQNSRRFKKVDDNKYTLQVKDAV